VSDGTLVRFSTPQSVPADVPIPQGGELIPKVVRATIDGSGAGTAYYAAVQVLDPNNNVKGSYISSSIAAGASADVTWFHGLAGGLPTPLGSQVLRAFGRTILGSIPNVPAGGSAVVSFDVAVTSDSSQLIWNTVLGQANSYLSFGAPYGTPTASSGWAICTATAVWPSGTAVDCYIDQVNGNAFFHDSWSGMSLRDPVAAAAGGPTLTDLAILSWEEGSGSEAVAVRLTNNDGTASAPDHVDFTCTWFQGLGFTF
jgi:hypothetical protein